MLSASVHIPRGRSKVKALSYLRAIRQRLWLLLVCPLVAAAAAAGVSLALPPVYEAKVSLLVRPAQPLAVTDPSVAALTSDQVSRTYATLMLERPLLEEVARELGLQATPDQLRRKISVSPQANTTILDVTVRDTDPRQARDIANRLVDDLIAEVKQIQQQEATNPNARSADNLVVVAPAVTPDRPSSPDVPLNVGLALVAGLVLAVLFALLLDQLDQSVKGEQDLRERTGMPVLGHIPFVTPAKGSRGELVALALDSQAAEAYRALRTNLLFSAVDREARTILVTSPEPGEGKSRTVANLAVVLAGAGHQTLLVDADFRRPSQHRIFARVRNLGLSNLVIRERAPADVIVPADQIPNLWLLTSGSTPPNPSEVLGSSSARELLSGLKQRFAYVLIDSPPVNPVTDASVLAAMADATLLVVEAGRTTYPELRRATEALERVGARPLGVVLNKLRAPGREYYYGYGDPKLKRSRKGAAAPAESALGAGRSTQSEGSTARSKLG